MKDEVILRRPHPIDELVYEDLNKLAAHHREEKGQ
jgi:hypothetical protein